MSGLQQHLLPTSSENSGSQRVRHSVAQRSPVPVAAAAEGPSPAAADETVAAAVGGPSPAAADETVAAALEGPSPAAADETAVATEDAAAGASILVPRRRVSRSTSTASQRAPHSPAISDSDDAHLRGELAPACLIGPPNGEARISVRLVNEWNLIPDMEVSFLLEVNGVIVRSYPFRKVTLKGCSSKKYMWLIPNLSFMRTLLQADCFHKGWRKPDENLILVLSRDRVRMTNEECMGKTLTPEQQPLQSTLLARSHNPAAATPTRSTASLSHLASDSSGCSNASSKKRALALDTFCAPPPSFRVQQPSGSESVDESPSFASTGRAGASQLLASNGAVPAKAPAGRVRFPGGPAVAAAAAGQGCAASPHTRSKPASDSEFTVSTPFVDTPAAVEPVAPEPVAPAPRVALQVCGPGSYIGDQKMVLATAFASFATELGVVSTDGLAAMDVLESWSDNQFKVFFPYKYTLICGVHLAGDKPAMRGLLDKLIAGNM